MEGTKENVEEEYNLLETTRQRAMEIVQFLVSYHKLRQIEIDFRE